MILLLDNTVLSNFALVNLIDLLPIVLRSQAATTPQVIDEYDAGVAKDLLPEISWDWLEIVELKSEERTRFQDHLRRVNAGEAACLAVAGQRGGRILTDDRDARKLAAQLTHQVPASHPITKSEPHPSRCKDSAASGRRSRVVFAHPRRTR